MVARDYSLRTFERARREITEIDLERIAKYSRKAVSAMLERDLESPRQYWRTLTEAIQVLYYHPLPTVRHEAAFVLSGVSYHNELEQVVVVQALRMAVRRDPSIIVQHESLEALGEIFCIAAVGAAADMAKIIRFRQLYHEDVVDTAMEAFDSIVRYLRRQRGFGGVVRELLEWRGGQKT